MSEQSTYTVALRGACTQFTVRVGLRAVREPAGYVFTTENVTDSYLRWADDRRKAGKPCLVATVVGGATVHCKSDDPYNNGLTSEPFALLLGEVSPSWNPHLRGTLPVLEETLCDLAETLALSLRQTRAWVTCAYESLEVQVAEPADAGHTG